jgi:hypothetical protein
VLLTRAPLSTHSKASFPFDLHVLGTPPTFILSQDQTLRIRSGLFISLSLPTILLLTCTVPYRDKKVRTLSHLQTQGYQPLSNLSTPTFQTRQTHLKLSVDCQADGSFAFIRFGLTQSLELVPMNLSNVKRLSVCVAAPSLLATWGILHDYFLLSRTICFFLLKTKGQKSYIHYYDCCREIYKFTNYILFQKLKFATSLQCSHQRDRIDIFKITTCR